MKIVQIASLYSPYIGGGAERTAERIALGLIKRGHELEVISVGPGSTDIQEKTTSNIPVRRLSRRNIYFHHNSKELPSWKKALFHTLDSYNPFMKTRIVKELSEIRPDVALVHNLQGLSVSVWSACNDLKIPIVQVLHDYYLICPKVTLFKDGHNCEKQCTSCSRFRWANVELSNKVAAVVGVSNFILNRHLTEGLFSKTPIKLANHNANNIQPSSLNSLSNKSKVINIGFIGALSEVKGVELLCRAFIEAQSQSGDKKLKLRIAGSGEQGYVQLLKQKFNHPDIAFIGQVNPDEFYSTVDFTVVPSLWHEPLGNIVYESMAKGVPVIGSHCGGIPEMIQNRVNGVTFDPYNIQSLVAAIITLATEPNLLDQMIKNCRESVAKYLDVESWLDKYEELLISVTKSV